MKLGKAPAHCHASVERSALHDMHMVTVRLVIYQRHLTRQGPASREGRMAGWRSHINNMAALLRGAAMLRRPASRRSKGGR